MTKAEMEAHGESYLALLSEAQSAEHDGDYHKAVELAVSSWPHIDGMMQYERRYEDAEFASIETIDMVLTYAPLLFESQSLDALESLLRECRRI